MRLKRIICLILSVTIAAGILSGCQAETHDDAELARAAELGIGKYPETDNAITYAEFMAMLDAVVSLAGTDDPEGWQNAFSEARQSQQTMTRREGMVAVYMAAETMGENYYNYNSEAGWEIFSEIEEADAEWKFWDELWAGDYGMFPDVKRETLNGEEYYVNAGYFYSMNRISLFSEKTIFDYDSETKSMRPADPLTYTEGLRAAVRLYDSFQNTYSAYSEPSETVPDRYAGVEVVFPDDPIPEEEKYADAPPPVIASMTMPEDYSSEPVPFKTEIDDFYAQFKEYPITLEYKDASDHYNWNGFGVRKLEIDGIHLYEVKKDDNTLKPLVIQLHGAGTAKSIYSAISWEEENVCFVSIDCAANGESQDGPLQAPAVFMETVRDIDVLIEYYNTIPDVDASNFGLFGTSMGGETALLYVIYGKYKPTAINVEIANPEPLANGPMTHCFDKGTEGVTSIWTLIQLLNFVNDFKPANHPEMFTDIWVYACCGQDDFHNPPQKMEAFKQAVEDLGGEKFIFRAYEGISHEVPDSWRENEVKDFFSKLRS